jgi:hypothetical protein
MAKRKSLSKRTRFEVFKRDRFTCQYCGRTPPTVTLEIDHIIAVANGGTNQQGNLLTSCFDCNSGKSDKPLTDVAPPLAKHAAVERERLDQLRAYNELLLEQRDYEAASVKRIGCHFYNQQGTERDKYFFGESRARSVRIFLKRLAEAEILEAVDIAFAKRPGKHPNDEPTWKYFCGVCWKMIRDKQEPQGSEFEDFSE